MNEIQFVSYGKAMLVKRPTPALGPKSVLTKTLYTVVSSGTERANLIDAPNTFAYQKWPKVEGYSGIGIVQEVGPEVEKVKTGDRVLVYHGTHADYSVVNEDKIYPVPEGVKSEEAVMCIIGAMGLGGLRKTNLELGESCMVIGAGPLGLFAVIGAKNSGAYPVIAVDLSKERRELALKMGADYALDSTSPTFHEDVMKITGGEGVNAIVEVTGSSRAIETALDVVARFGRISLNGCTRISDAKIDFYKQVHCPGITIVGAHNMARPTKDRSRGMWTNEGDVLSLVKLLKGKRFDLSPMIGEIDSPNDCEKVYDRLVNDPKFPIGVLFDWSNFKE